MSSVKLSVIVLAVNETESLEKVVEKLIEFEHFIEKILIVSPKFVTNECKKIQHQLKEKYRKIETLIQGDEFPGIGGAVKFSIQFINTKYFCWIDADGETDPKYLEEMYENIIKDKSIDIINASRFKNKNIIIKNYGFLSSILTYCFQNLCQILFESKITDYTVAYRIYKTAIFKKFSFTSNDQSFSLESIILPLLNDEVKVLEIYYQWTKRSDGESGNSLLNKLSYFKIVYKYFIFKIKNKILK